MFDDFDTQIQSDELAGYDYWYEEWPTPPEESEGEYVSPDEYDDWMVSDEYDDWMVSDEYDDWMVYVY